MSDSPQYYCLLTDAGAALEAQALAEGKPVRLTHIAVGDGNGAVPTPDVSTTALVHEVHRRAIDARTQSDDDPNIAILHATIPAEEGGWWIRELGVYAEPLDEGGEPVLYAYGNHAPYYKMLPQAGQMTSHELQVPVITSSAANIEIVIPDTGYASATQFRLLAGIVESLRDRRQASWTLEEAVEEGGDLILPEGITYLPGRRAIEVLSWDGMVCHSGRQYREKGDADAPSDRVVLLFSAPAGSEFSIHIAGHSDALPLSESDADVPGTELVRRMDALERQVTHVAERAVYAANPTA